MPATVNAVGRRKVRCPKCTALLTEPSTPIYECPICATLLLAKGIPGNSEGESSEKRLDRNGEDEESIQRIRGSDSNLDEPMDSKAQKGMECVEKEMDFFEESNGVLRSGSSDGIDNAVPDDQPLYRKRHYLPRAAVQRDAFTPKIDPLSFEKPLYTPSPRRLPHSPDGSGSSDKSESGSHSFGLESTSPSGSEADFDFPPPLSEKSHTANMLEEISLVERIDGCHLEEDGNITMAQQTDSAGVGFCPTTNIKTSEGGVGDLSYEVRFSENRTGLETSDAKNKVDLDFDVGDNDEAKADLRSEPSVDLGISRSVEEDSLAESVSRDELLVHSGQSLGDQLPLESADNQTTLTESGFAIAAKSDTNVGCSTEETLEASDHIMQHPHDGEVGDLGSLDWDKKEDYRNGNSEGLLSAFSLETCQSNSEADSRYAGVWTPNLINTEVVNSLDVSFCDWQSMKIGKGHEGLTESIVDDKGVLNSDTGVHASLSSSKDGGAVGFSTIEKFGNLESDSETEKNVSIMPNQAISDRSDSSSVILATTNGTHSEQSSIPRRTAAMQKFLQRTALEITAQTQLHHTVMESGAHIYEAPYVGKYESSDLPSSLANIDQSNTESPVSDNRLVNDLNVHVAQAAHVEDVDKKPLPVKWIERMAAATMENISSRKDDTIDQIEDREVALLERAAWNKQLSSGASANHIYGPGQSSIGRTVSGNHEAHALNMHASDLEDPEKKSAASSWSQKMVTAMHPHLREAVDYEKGWNLDQNGDNEWPVLQGTAFTEQHRSSGISASSIEPGQMARSHPHPGSTVVSHERLHEVLVPQRSENVDYADLHMAGLNRHRKQMFVQHERFLNSPSFAQPDSVHEGWQEHAIFSQRQNAVPQSSDGTYHDSTSNWHSRFAGRSQQSLTNLNLNQEYVSDPIGLLPQSASSMVYPYMASSHPLMLSPYSLSHCPHHSLSTICTFCMQQSHLQQPQMLEKALPHHCVVCCSQPTSMAHQPARNEAWDSSRAHASHYANPSVGGSQTRFYPLHAQRRDRYDYQAPLARPQKHYPPLPQEGAAPYVLCQDCNRLLQVPVYLPPVVGNIQKLRCASCGKISKFSIHQQVSNHADIKDTQSLRISSTGRSMMRATSTPPFLQSLHPDAATVHSPGFASTFLCNEQCGALPISKMTQSAQSIGNQDLGRRTNFVSGLRSQYERVEYHKLPQTKATLTGTSASLRVDGMHYPRHITSIVQDQGLSSSQFKHGNGDNSVGMYSEAYLSSSPSSASSSSPARNVSSQHVHENKYVEVSERDGATLGRRQMSNGLFSSSTMNDQDRSAFEAPSFSDGFFQNNSIGRRMDLSSATTQASYHESRTDASHREPLRPQWSVWTAAGSQQQLTESDYSRSSSTSQLGNRSAAPGSPLVDHFAWESADFGPGTQHRGSLRGSGNGIRSAPWSPAAGSPLYDQLTHDASSDFDERSYQKQRDLGRVHGSSAQDVSRGPKYFAGLLKKSIKDFGKGVQGNNYRRKVIVNGHLISEANVKRAEERAGAIHSGSFWYDYQAGFWGVMGGPCIGIIPPFIEELNFPLSRDCAGGRTGILVNGRELHQKDLEVLGGRGLPTIPGKAYMVDIKGRVVDDAGQHLKGLGKLAPTIERKGRGCGMFQPSGLQS